jgi:hypothetical protein
VRMAAKGMVCTATRGTMQHVHVGIEMPILATRRHCRGRWLWAQPRGSEGHDAVRAGGVDVSYPRHVSLPLLPSVVGHGGIGGPLREGWPSAQRR